MNVVTEFILSHENNWEEELKNKNIKIKKDDDGLIILNYDVNCDFSSPLIKECRGIILNSKDNFNVVCYPFTKFFNYHEPYADPIDWESAQIQEKIDGSIIKCFWNPIRNHWQFASNSCINAFEAVVGTANKSLGELIASSNLYMGDNQLNVSALDKNLTYIFELVSPCNQIVIKYPYTYAYHIGTRNNITGQELNVDIGIEKPKLYTFSEFEECKKCTFYVDYATYKMNTDDSQVEHEGLVVIDKYYHRIKIKTPQYLKLHHAFSNQVPRKKNILELLETDDYSLEELIAISPSGFKTAIAFYYYQKIKLLEELEEYLVAVKSYYQLFNQDRKKVALKIKNHKLGSLGFYALDHPSLSAQEILKSISPSKYLRLIDDYVVEYPFF